MSPALCLTACHHSPHLNLVSSSSMDHKHGSCGQHEPWTIHLTWPALTAQITDINMASWASMDHRSISRELNPESEPFFTLDILLLFRVRVIMCLGSGPMRASGCYTPFFPWCQLPCWHPGHNHCASSHQAHLGPALSSPCNRASSISTGSIGSSTLGWVQRWPSEWWQGWGNLVIAQVYQWPEDQSCSSGMWSFVLCSHNPMPVSMVFK